MTIDELFEQLDARQGRVPLDALRSLMGTLDVSAADLDYAISFGETGYRRNLLRRTPSYEALVLCWSQDQRSPIHDHAQSTCGVRVVQGEATETRYEHDVNGFLHPVGTERFPQGATAGSQDAEIHEIANLAHENLVTLHIYSPPLGAMRTYTASTSQARDIWSGAKANLEPHPAS